MSTFMVFHDLYYGYLRITTIGPSQSYAGLCQQRILSQAARRGPVESAGKAKVLVEGIVGRLSAQELFKSDHLFLTPTPLEYSVPVSPTLLSVQGVRLERGVEHVRRVDLRGQVTVVASIIASNEVAERGRSVAPVALQKVSISVVNIVSC